MAKSIENLENAFDEMFDFITDLPSGLDGFESDFDSAFEELRELKATLTPPNEPLTLEQLLRMDGAPVWLDVAGGMWALVDALDGCLWLDRGGSIDIAKFAGKAYRRPPEVSP